MRDDCELNWRVENEYENDKLRRRSYGGGRRKADGKKTEASRKSKRRRRKMTSPIAEIRFISPTSHLSVLLDTNVIRRKTVDAIIST